MTLLLGLLSACSTLLNVDFTNFKSPDGGFGPDGGGGPGCKTCQDLGAQCGIQDDGCGNSLDCGKTCPGNGVCVGKTCQCTPKSCADLNVQCGTVDNGCGNSLDCGACAAGLSCVNNACKCVAKTCSDYNAVCGNFPTGCGTDTINCGTCQSAGAPYCANGQCTTTPCTPKTCSQAGNPCDTVPDGCGGVVGPCTTCTSPQTCGGSGVAHQCGCTAKTCSQAGNPCDAVPDGCGGKVGPCVSCTSPQSCGGGGVADQCGCTPNGSCPAGSNCGTVPDGCGGNISCGPNCVAPDSCGGGGQANVCGCTSIAGSCSNCCGTGTDNCNRACSGSSCCGGGGGGCFAPGTMVLMADGSQHAIETLLIGDGVMTLDPTTHALVPARVTRVMVHPAGTENELLVLNGRVRVTPNHPMYTPSGTVLAGQLTIGDEIVVVTDPAANPRTEAVQTIQHISNSSPVYTLWVSTGGVFIVDHTVALQKQ